MTTQAEERALSRFREILVAREYKPQDRETLRKDVGAIFGLAHLVINGNGFMPRLSVGLYPFSSTGVVLTTDLHVLVSTEKYFSYSFTQGDELRMEQDLLAVGLTWLEAHLDLGRLTQALEARVTLVSRPPARRWPWSTLTLRDSKPDEPRVSPVVLRALSYCYELQSRFNDALRSWEGYLATKTLGRDDELLDRLRLLQEKAGGRS